MKGNVSVGREVRASRARATVAGGVRCAIHVDSPKARDLTARQANRSSDAAASAVKKLRVLIADDHELVRQGLAALLAIQPDIEVVANVGGVDDIAPALDAAPCDMVLLDLQMDRDATGDIESLARRARVVVLTASEDPDDAVRAIRFGAHAVVFKRFAAKTLLVAIRSAARGEVWMPPTMQAYIADSLRNGTVDPLSAREREIVGKVALGFRNSEVAKGLFISELTVKTHLNNIFKKLDVRDRVELTLYAVRRGLVRLGR